MLCVLSFATFVGFSSALAPQLVIAPLATLYSVSRSGMAYQNSASTAGMAVGGLFFRLLSRVTSRPSALLWSIIGLLLAQTWSALMTGKDDYTPYLVSRGVAGFCGSIVGVLGPQMLIDMFFLHQRGRAFTFFFFWFDLGTMAGPTLSALVADDLGWRSGFWWTVILCGVSALAIFCSLSNTDYDRTGAVTRGSGQPWAQERIETFFPGSRNMPRASFAELVRPRIPLKRPGEIKASNFPSYKLHRFPTKSLSPQ